jgi:tetratricopeptide (TPR) repeat protein
MAVTGQFGRALTGNGSLSSAISSIASEFVTLRTNRIYDAYINEEALDGTVIDAQTAIAELKKLMAGTTEDTRTGQSIADMIRAVRKANRTRTLNKLDADLAEMGAEKGDYGKMVTAIQEMLLDPTLNPDDEAELRKELSTAVQMLFDNSRNQFNASGKITFNGKTIDFDGGANYEQFLQIYDSVARANPDMADKINRQKYEAEVSVAVSQANAIWASVSRTTDSQKLQGYVAQLNILRKAYDKLKAQGLEGGEAGVDLLDNIRTIEGYEANSKSNIGQESSNKRISGMDTEVYGALYDIDDALALMGVNTGEGGIANLLLTNPNAAYNAIDMAIAMNGGSTSITVDGKVVEIDRDTIYAVIADTKASAVSANNWAKNNPNVSASNKIAIRNYVTSATALFNNVPNLKVEDAYDNARTTLETALEANPDDINARVNALKAFGKAIRTLAGTTGNTAVRTALTAEADLFESGKQPKQGVMVYGEWSGNLDGGPGGESALAVGSQLGRLINPRVDSGDVSISEAIALIYSQQGTFNAGGGEVYIDGITGERVATAVSEDVSAYDNSQGMGGTTMVSNSFGDVTVDTQHSAVYARYRIVNSTFSGNTTDAGLKAATVGWISVITDDKGNPIEVVLFNAPGSGNGVERVVGAADVATILATMGMSMGNIPLRQVGNNTVVVASAAFVAAMNQSRNGFNANTTDITNGDSDFWSKLVTNGGYTSPTTFANLETEGFYKLLDAGKIKTQTGANGEVLVFVAGKGVGENQVWTNITGSLGEELLGVIREAQQLIDAGAPPPGGVPGYVPPEGGGSAPNEGGSGVGGGGIPGGPAGTSRGGLNLREAIDAAKARREAAAAARAARLAPETGEGQMRPTRDGLKRTTTKPPVTPVKNPTIDGYSAIEKSRENQAMLGTFMRNMPTASATTPQSASTGAQGKKVQGVERVARKAV